MKRSLLSTLQFTPFIAALVAGLPALVRGVDAPVASGVVVQANIAYLGSDRREQLDLYLPADRTRPVAAVVWVHGGGWMTGDRARSREKNIGNTLAGWGYAVASISYTLGKGAWPQNLYDVKNAIRFLRARGAEYGIDPDRLAVAGGSAGGHLALLVGFTAGKDWEPTGPYPGVSNQVRAILDFYGPTHHLSRVKADKQGRATAERHMGNAVEVFAGGDPTNQAALVASSPVTHVASGVPPVLIAHGLADTTVFHGQSTELAEALKRVGVPHDLILLPGVGHTFDLDSWNDRPLGHDLRTPVRRFLDQWLAPQ
jgi:acetyl esterase/lipase